MNLNLNLTKEEAIKYAGLALVGGGITGILGFGIALGAAIAPAAAFFMQKRSVPVTAAGEGASSVGSNLLSFMHHNGVPNYPAQEVADFQMAYNAENPAQPLVVDGRYTARVQMALAMSLTGPNATVPNPVL